MNQVTYAILNKFILKKFAVTVVRHPLLILFLNISAHEEFLISICIMLQTYESNYLNEFKPNFVVLIVFMKKPACDLK